MTCETQPSSTEIKIVDDLFFKSMEIKHKHTLVPQHSHTYDHISFLAKGSVRVWCDDTLMGEYKAPYAITIKQKTFHRFLTLEDDTFIWCIHRLHDSENVDIHEENKLNDKDHEYLHELARRENMLSVDMEARQNDICLDK